MKVILSIDAVRFPLTGIGRYTYELARQLPDEVPGLDLQFMAGHRFVPRLPTEKAFSNPAQGRSLAVRVRQRLQNSPAIVSAHRVWLSRRQSHSLKEHNEAIFHGPQFYLPRFDGKSVVTIHDLSVFTWAHCHPGGRARMMRQEIVKSVSRASMVLTDSEFTRQELVAFFSLPPERVRAIPLASAACFRPRLPTELDAVLPRLGLRPGNYCLYSGTIEPRKNLGALLDAYQRLPTSLRHRLPLVLCGYQGWQSADLHARIQKAAGEGWVRYLGYVSGAELPHVFAGARLFAFPSVYEGFGLPVLEAMASGVPVVCSNSSSLPEVAGDAALMCAPHNVDTLTDLLRQGLEDEGWRSEAQRKGLAQAARFSWAQCARKTGAAYRAVRSD
ncbi:glycosyltransferase family 4 protein [Thauera aromatica]|uniref:glycosyltransferase family 4 protein n=1 Tax=Thauera aromatica TaxID=59405 RepID=UPI001FFCF5C9|nr:glycosyltransferase family 1 protein [Thauera aromatica]MCK2089610.1 glycosyltransferase family 4 protein [Thauera aromatica]